MCFLGPRNYLWTCNPQDRGAAYGLSKYSVFKIGNEYVFYDDELKNGNVMMWYSNKVTIPDDVEPTIPVCTDY